MRPKTLWLHVENMIKVSKPKGFAYVGMEITDAESSSDGPDPSLQVDQLREDCTREESYLGQVENDLRSRPDHNRVQKLVHRFGAEHVFYRLDDLDVTQVFPGEPD